VSLVKVLKFRDQGRIQLFRQIADFLPHRVIFIPEFDIKTRGVQGGHDGEQAKIVIDVDRAGGLAADTTRSQEAQEKQQSKSTEHNREIITKLGDLEFVRVSASKASLVQQGSGRSF
jgi:hypothetical protein